MPIVMVLLEGQRPAGLAEPVVAADGPARLSPLGEESVGGRC
jgi:hypothetical protein